MIISQYSRTMELIEQEFLCNDLPWSLGYSGGKDSSALLKLTYNSILNIRKPKKKINIVYCDTGVEIPIISDFVKKTLKLLELDILDKNAPFTIRIVEPDLSNRFFSKVIGHGYPTPTNKFRWCTDRLRVNPIQNYYNSKDKNIVLIGVRKGESKERDKIIFNHSTDKPYFLKQVNYPNTSIFAPILDFGTDEIWNIVKSFKLPKALDGTASLQSRSAIFLNKRVLTKRTVS